MTAPRPEQPRPAANRAACTNSPAADLQPELRGLAIELEPGTCPALAPGRAAAIRIARVLPAGEDDRQLFLMVGDLDGPNGWEAQVKVLVYGSALRSLAEASAGHTAHRTDDEEC